MKYYSTFYGNEISEYGLKYGFVDYSAFAKSFDAVLNNDIVGKTWGVCGEWEQISGFSDDGEENVQEVFQWYIIDSMGVDLCTEGNEIVYYNADLDMYVWGVTHWGTSWDYVLTDIPLRVKEG